MVYDREELALYLLDSKSVGTNIVGKKEAREMYEDLKILCATWKIYLLDVKDKRGT